MTKLRFLSTREVADAIGKTPRTVARMAAKGELQPIHKGDGVRGAMLFDAETVEKYVEELAA